MNIFARGKAVSSFAPQTSGSGTLVRGANDDFRKLTVLFLSLAFVAGDAAKAEVTIESDAIWKRHTIDNSSRGADGVRLRDVNGDGLPDIATGWEEGGVIRVYLHPGYASAKQPWPSVTVGEVNSPEDAVLVDLDRDGAFDVVSSCEGRVRTMFFHWAPRLGDQQSGAQQRQRFLDPSCLDDRGGLGYQGPTELDVCTANGRRWSPWRRSDRWIERNRGRNRLAGVSGRCSRCRALEVPPLARRRLDHVT